MNKIYRIVWSKVRGCYMVASEFAKRYAKGCGVLAGHAVKRAGVTLAVAAMLTGGFSGSAFATQMLPYNFTDTETSSVLRVEVSSDGILWVQHQATGEYFHQDLTAIFGGADTNTTYTLTQSGDKRTITLTGSDHSVNSVENTVLVSSSNALTVGEDGTISLSLADTAGNTVTGLGSIQTFVDSEIKNNAKDGDMTLDGNDTTIEQAINTTYQEASKHNTVVAGNNITVSEGTNAAGGIAYTVATSEDVTFSNVTTNNLTADTITAGPVTIDENGLDAGGTPITNVADGVEANDAATVGQLQRLDANIGGRISTLGSRLEKGIAGAGALAALHPMDFDPDSKLQLAVGYGNYHDKHAMALGMFYRPDESVMFNVGGCLGNGENIVNAGVTFALDGGKNRITRSRTAMAKEIMELRSLVTQMAARMDRIDNAADGTAVMFPDVPENHWAYEYIKRLQEKGIIEGYPDGRFGGDRSMTRYEFAAMLDRAIQKGAHLDSGIVQEFKPELGRIYVERISGSDADYNKVERVRVRNQDKETRDAYGNLLSVG